MNEMKISVIIPAYNHARWLPKCIESVLNQTLKPHEIIVVDDGSTDNTAEIIAKYPVRYIRQENAGCPAARNRALREATGDWIAIVDADDYWLPQKLELQARAIRNEALCYCGVTRLYKDGHTEEAEFYDTGQIKSALRHKSALYPSALLIRKDAITQVGGFNEQIAAGEDWEICLKLSRIFDFVGIREPLVIYNVTEAGMTANPTLIINSLEQIVSAASAHLPPIRRFIESHRLRSERLTLVAVTFRQKGDSKNCLRYACRAFLQWPSLFYDKAAKVALIELGKILFGAA